MACEVESSKSRRLSTCFNGEQTLACTLEQSQTATVYEVVLLSPHKTRELMLAHLLRLVVCPSADL